MCRKKSKEDREEEVGSKVGRCVRVRRENVQKESAPAPKREREKKMALSGLLKTKV
jgi:hypothetical protein